MAYKDLLVHVDDTRPCAARVQAAVDLAAAHGAHLSGVYIIADPSPAVFATGHVPPEVVDSFHQLSRGRAEAALARFAEVAGRNQIAFETRIDRVLYTEVADDDLAQFVAGYDLGALLSCKGIAEGVENSNFLLHTQAGYYILTLYEKRVHEEDLPFFLGLMQHLAARGLSCPLPLPRKDGTLFGSLSGRPAALISFLEGMWLRKPEAKHCREVGKALAQMHVAGADFELRRPNW